MKKHWILLLLLPLLLGTSSSSSIKVNFHQGSLTTAKQLAAREGKLYFVEFMADWCSPCQWMDETTFTDTELADYIHQNYVAVKVNIDDFDGYAYKQLYNIKLLPSFLIFNSQGELLDQYAESLAPARLLSILKHYNVPANRGVAANDAPAEPDPALSATGQQPAWVPNGEDAAVTEPEIPVVSYEVTSTPTTSASARPPGRPDRITGSEETTTDSGPYTDRIETESPEYTNEAEITTGASSAEPMSPGTGLFRFSVSRQPGQGYSLQTGVYAAYENVLLEAAKLENDFAEYPVIVHISVLNNKRVYRVMLGTFPQKRDVIQFKRQLERYGIEGVIRSLATL